MKNVLIIGANGQVGKIIVQKMKEAAGFTPTALFRKEEQKDFFEKRNVNFKIVDLEEEVDILANAMAGMNAAVFAAGSGGTTGLDKTLTVDLDGAVKSMEAAQQAGVNRFVIISAMHAGERTKWDDSGIKPYLIAKHYADRMLQFMGLDYTILRPGRLLDKEGTGKITVTNPASGEGVPREDVANTILEVLNQDNTIGKILKFNEGDELIKEVLKDS